MFPHLQEKNGFQTSNLVFFSFSKKIWGFQTWQKKRASYITKLFGFAFLFFWQFLPLGLSWAKQKTTRFFCWEQKKRSCFKKFLRVWFSLFWVKLSWERRLKFFSTLFLSLKNKLSQRENFHYVRLVLIFDTIFLKSLILVLIFDTVILKSFDIRHWYFVFWKVILVICYVI